MKLSKHLNLGRRRLEHRFYKKLAADFPEVISQEVVRSKWEDYLRLKHVARDLVKH